MICPCGNSVNPIQMVWRWIRSALGALQGWPLPDLRTFVEPARHGGENCRADWFRSAGRFHANRNSDWLLTMAKSSGKVWNAWTSMLRLRVSMLT
jgi:hypothetical protein